MQEKIINFGEFSVKVVNQFKDTEMEIFDKGKKNHRKLYKSRTNRSYRKIHKSYRSSLQKGG